MPAPPVEQIYPANLPRHTNAEWRARNEEALTPNFGVRRLAIVRGSGARVWDAEGKEYLDFLTGISVNNLGHCHPAITKAIQQQAETLVHCSNLYYIPIQIELARLLTRHSFAERVFFGNSGAEANEAAIKIARKWGHENRGADVDEIITMEGSFHGRTLGTLAATGQTRLREGFHPHTPGFFHAKFNDLDSVERLITPRTCAIMVEPVTGEGGIQVARQDYLAGLRKLCIERNLLLIFDEIQCGLGRTGSLFAYQGFGVEPDVMTLAKSLGGGLAMGAMLTTAEIARAFSPGSHGSTMGGNALTCAAALAYLTELIEGDHIENAKVMGTYFVGRLAEELRDHANVVEIRNRGLMVGVEVRERGPEIVLECENQGLLINCTAGQTLRLHAPLNVTRDEIDHAVRILTAALG
jgi:acetylornithine/N-succinyldiaminopimelate aminotransferase